MCITNCFIHMNMSKVTNVAAYWLQLVAVHPTDHKHVRQRSDALKTSCFLVRFVRMANWTCCHGEVRQKLVTSVNVRAAIDYWWCIGFLKGRPVSQGEISTKGKRVAWKTRGRGKKGMGCFRKPIRKWFGRKAAWLTLESWILWLLMH